MIVSIRTWLISLFISSFFLSCSVPTTIILVNQTGTNILLRAENKIVSIAKNSVGEIYQHKLHPNFIIEAKYPTPNIESRIWDYRMAYPPQTFEKPLWGGARRL